MQILADPRTFKEPGLVNVARFQFEATRSAEKQWLIRSVGNISGQRYRFEAQTESASNPLLPHQSPQRTAPITKSRPYLNDGITYVRRGEKVKYEHPDRSRYGLNPSEFRTLEGQFFYHFQASKNLQPLLKLPVQILGLVMGFAFAYSTVQAADPRLRLVAGLLGSIIGIIMAANFDFVTPQYLADEVGAIWLWIKKSDWKAIEQTARDFRQRTITYLKIGDTPAFTMTIPVGKPRIVP